MRSDPFTDALHFLVGQTPDHDALGQYRYALVAVYWAALLGGILVAARCWAVRPGQRSGRDVAIALCRILIGTMWLQGSLWKLPLPVAGGFEYWTGQLAEHSWLPAQVRLVRTVLLPHLDLLDPAVFGLETLLGFAFCLGLFVRAAGLVGIAFTLNLWVGLYHRGDEWPWNYLFLAMVLGFFVLDRGGECLGLDGLRSGRGIERRIDRY